MLPATPQRHQAEEEESYFASMTDMLVGLIFIFIIMLMAFALQYRGAQADLSRDEAEIRSELEAIREENVTLSRQLQATEAELEQARARLRATETALSLTEEELAAVEQLIAQRDAEIAQLEQRRDDLEATLAAQNEKLAALETEIAGLEDENANLADRLQQIQGERDRLRARVAELEDAETRYRETRGAILRTLAGRLEREGLRVSIDERHGILRLPEDVLFRKASATIDADGRRALTQLARALTTIVPCYTPQWQGLATCDAPRAYIESIVIEGHTDSDPMLAPGGNLGLSTSRAVNTYFVLLDALPSAPVPLDELTSPDRQGLFAASGYGEHRSVAPNDSEVNKRKNRRIDLRFLMTGPPPQALDDIEETVRAPAQ